MSDSQINRRIGQMKLVTRWASGFEIDLLPADPLADLRKLRVSRVKKEKRTFSLEEARKILAATEGTDWHLPFIIYLTTGARKTVLMLTEGRDWDSESHILTLRMGEGNKVNHEDRLPMGRFAAESLTASNGACPGRQTPLFPSSRGGFRSPKAPYNALQKACRAAGVEPGGCHAMRRCAATEIARMQGSDIASLVLGHSDGKRTLAQAEYIDWIAEDARKAVQAMEDALLA